MGFWDDLGRSISSSLEMNHQQKMLQLQQIKVTLQFARNKYNFGELQAALDAYEQALAMAQVGASSEVRSMILIEMGDIYREIKQPDKALRLYKFGLEFAKKNDDRANLLNRVGLVYVTLGQMKQALEYYQKALTTVYFGRKERSLKRTILRNAGLTCEELEDYQQARTYLSEALELAKKLKDADSENELRGFLERLPK